MLEPKRLAAIRAAQEEGINGYNTLSSRDYCVMLGELLADRDALSIRLENERDELREKLLAAEVERDHMKNLACHLEANDAADCSFQAELRGLLCPDSGPEDKQAILQAVRLLFDKTTAAGVPPKGSLHLANEVRK